MTGTSLASEWPLTYLASQKSLHYFTTFKACRDLMTIGLVGYWYMPHVTQLRLRTSIWFKFLPFKRRCRIYDLCTNVVGYTKMDIMSTSNQETFFTLLTLMSGMHRPLLGSLRQGPLIRIFVTPCQLRNFTIMPWTSHFSASNGFGEGFTREGFSCDFDNNVEFDYDIVAPLAWIHNPGK